jgi:large subunit ribosomal protein L25
MDNEEILIESQKRDVIGRQVKNIRKEGQLPAIVYGQGMKSIPIVLDAKSTQRLVTRLGPSTLITLNVDGEPYHTLLRDRQYNYLTGDIIHLDFLVVSLTETVKTAVSVQIEGEAPAVNDFNGILVTNLESIDIEGLPMDLPNRILVDVSVLKEIGDSISVRDLALPPNITLHTDPDEAVVLITAQAVEEEVEEEELLDEELDAEPELVEKGKRDEEEEDGEEDEG